MNKKEVCSHLGSMNNMSKEAKTYLNSYLGSRNDKELAIELLTKDSYINNGELQQLDVLDPQAVPENIRKESVTTLILNEHLTWMRLTLSEHYDKKFIPGFTRDFIDTHLDECLSMSKDEIVSMYNEYIRKRLNEWRERGTGNEK
jgi:hypothetical protein